VKSEKKGEVLGKALPAEAAGQKCLMIWTGILLAIIIALLFWRDFMPGNVLFSNDCPYGGLVCEFNRLPTTLFGSWRDLNWLGNEDLSAAPGISTFFRLITVDPRIYAKWFCPFTLLFVGLCACFCFRRLKLAPMACILGGLAAALNSDFFSTSCWGVVSQIIGFGAMYIALGLLGSPGTKRQWAKTALAGLAVGVGVMEAYDIGALFSLLVAAFVIYHALYLRAREVAGWQKLGYGFLRTGLVAGCAAFIAVRALTGLVGTQISGIVGMDQDEQTKMAHFDQATTWSLPKIETLQVLIPGVFGYRDPWYMYEDDMPVDDQYWGSIGDQPGLPRLSGTGLYAGVLVVMVAAWAILQSFRRQGSPFTNLQRRAIWFWAAVLPVTLFLAYGKFAPFYRFFYALPYASTIRNPTKFMHLFSWTLVLIFAYGLHGLSVAYFGKQESLLEGRWAQFKNWLSKAAPLSATGSLVARARLS
jgi:hypothetical protein